ncbi:aminodeoxychorismate lyase [Lewinellaceae bacterium SD302]|nr:aminodeoxychorismate lyase [Lewinellaceae bacterium SD302]
MIKKIFLLVFLVGITLTGYAYYELMARPVVPADWADSDYLEVPRGASYEQVMDSLENKGVMVNRSFFDPLATRMAFKRDQMRSGRFPLRSGMSTVELIRHLRIAKQMTTNVILTTEREPMNVAAKAARFLQPDSLSFVRLFQNEAYLDSIGYRTETLQTLFIPNTYELYWNSTPREFMARMIKEHARFWDANDRRAKAEKLGMTPTEVYTLASIVEKESLQPTERPRIAGVYLNRLEQGILLQADPTVVFGIRQFDLGRVLYVHLESDSPYNTYRFAGLPPGPIAMSSPGSIDAVLNSEDHDYIYFCARGDGTGYHNFAETTAGHGRNRAIYAANLKARGIR